MSDNPQYYKKVKIGANKTAFYFKSLNEYNRFIDEVKAVAVGNAKTGFDRVGSEYDIDNKIATYSGNWYGTEDKNLIKGDVDSFLFNGEVQSFIDSFSNQKVKVDIIDLDQNKAIKFTEQEIGIFSFDLASLGLIRVFEYYSPLLKKIVSPNLVKGIKSQNGDLVFYHDYMPAIPAHKVKYDLKTSGYYSSILKRNVEKSELVEIVTDTDVYFQFPERAEIPQHIVERRQEVDEKGNKKFSSTFKKSFIYIPKVEKPLPRVDIIVGASYSWKINAKTQMIYGCMSAIAIAEKLSKSGVNYRIIACYPFETSGGGTRKSVYSFVNIKSEGEPLDKNKIAILISDARNFRLQVFKCALAAQYDAGYDANINPKTIGAIIDNPMKIKDAYMEYLSNQDNPEDKLAALNPASKIVFSGALSKEQAVNEYNRIINQISKL